LRYLSIILPLPVSGTFTYHCDDASIKLAVGCRVVVNFGHQRFLTGIIAQTDVPAPEEYSTKAIESVLDEQPLVSEEQIHFWQWMADYYMCSLGEVMKAALPAGLKLENKAKVLLNPDFQSDKPLKGKTAMAYHYLADGKAYEVSQLAKQLQTKNIAPLIKKMADKGLVHIEEELQQKYRPKLKAFFYLAPSLRDDDALEQALLSLKQAKRQQSFISILVDNYHSEEKIEKQPFLQKHRFSPAVYQALIARGYIIEEMQEVSRWTAASNTQEAPLPLSPLQQEALLKCQAFFQQKKVVLLHGVTASGKTEIYIHLIKEQLEARKQVLFLLPEIAITVEMLQRLTRHFGKQVMVYHSRYSDAQRTEVWRQINESTEGRLIIGARSAIFLPFKALGLIIVDEEHEDSYKQREPAPHYHARDAAVMLAHSKGAKIILGSATPSIESAYNGEIGKYGVVHLMERFSQVPLPQIVTVDMSEAYRKGRCKHHFSFELIEDIKATLAAGEQVILFQNRRGYSGFVECQSCGYVPRCKNCDISLSYHQYDRQLKCHYCGYSEKLPETCPQCGGTEINDKGMGTEKVAAQAQELFPQASIQRFDQDSTRLKHSFEKIIHRFQERQIDLLVGTQMIAKGLDFDNVGLVAIMNADNMMNFPDFRAHEKAYQLMSQVAGRSGRRAKQGKVILQSYTPDYSLIKAVKSYDYAAFYHQQIEERRDFSYPPVVKLIDISIRHKDPLIAQQAARLYSDKLREKFGLKVLGPEAPAVGRIKQLYYQKIMLKVDKKYPLQAVKDWLRSLAQALQKTERYKTVSLIFDVDI